MCIEMRRSWWLPAVWIGLLAIVNAAVAQPATAQHAPAPQSTAAQGGGYGVVDFKNGCSAGVQSALQQAVAELHAFAASPNVFEKIARADPTCAIAWWGAAMATRGNPLAGAPDAGALRAGRGFVDRAKGIGAGERERALIGALDVYFRTYPDQQARARAYAAAMEPLYRAQPEDADIASFYALALLEGVDLGDQTYARQRQAGRILEQVLAQHPDHPGALHYLIHAYDYAPLAAQALPAARRFGTIAPASMHAQHMPAHIFTILGLWEESIAANLRSTAVWRPESKGQRVGGDIADDHAFDFIAYARLQLAQDRHVRDDLDQIRRNGKPDTLGEARYALERGDWAAAMAVAVPTDAPFDAAIARFARGYGAARLGDAARARTEWEALNALRDPVARSAGDYWAGFVDIYARAIEAWIEKAEGRPHVARAIMREAANWDDGREKHILLENKLVQMREVYGELLLAVGLPSNAGRAFEKSLAHAPNRFRSIAGAARAAAAQNDAAAATRWYGMLAALAANADSERPDITEAHAYLAR